jgi:hypothetical protein
MKAYSPSTIKTNQPLPFGLRLAMQSFTKTSTGESLFRDFCGPRPSKVAEATEGGVRGTTIEHLLPILIFLESLKIE